MIAFILFIFMSKETDSALHCPQAVRVLSSVIPFSLSSKLGQCLLAYKQDEQSKQCQHYCQAKTDHTLRECHIIKHGHTNVKCTGLMGNYQIRRVKERICPLHLHHGKFPTVKSSKQQARLNRRKARSSQFSCNVCFIMEQYQNNRCASSVGLTTSAATALCALDFSRLSALGWHGYERQLGGFVVTFFRLVLLFSIDSCQLHKNFHFSAHDNGCMAMQALKHSCVCHNIKLKSTPPKQQKCTSIPIIS